MIDTVFVCNWCFRLYLILIKNRFNYRNVLSLHLLNSQRSDSAVPWHYWCQKWDPIVSDRIIVMIYWQLWQLRYFEVWKLRSSKDSENGELILDWNEHRWTATLCRNSGLWTRCRSSWSSSEKIQCDWYWWQKIDHSSYSWQVDGGRIGVCWCALRHHRQRQNQN